MSDEQTWENVTPPEVPTIPTMRQWLAQNYAELRAVKWDLGRKRDLHHRADPAGVVDAWEQVLIAGSRVAELELDRDRMLAALAAHELTWAHLYTECPVCLGQVSL